MYITLDQTGVDIVDRAIIKGIESQNIQVAIDFISDKATSRFFTYGAAKKALGLAVNIKNKYLNPTLENQIAKRLDQIRKEVSEKGALVAFRAGEEEVGYYDGRWMYDTWLAEGILQCAVDMKSVKDVESLLADKNFSSKIGLNSLTELARSKNNDDSQMHEILKKSEQGKVEEQNRSRTDAAIDRAVADIRDALRTKDAEYVANQVIAKTGLDLRKDEAPVAAKQKLTN